MAETLRSLDSYKDLHTGERCFLVGNGPSLSKLDLRKLDGELAFTVNRGYLAASVGWLKGSRARDNTLVQRIRDALAG